MPANNFFHHPAISFFLQLFQSEQEEKNYRLYYFESIHNYAGYLRDDEIY